MCKFAPFRPSSHVSHYPKIFPTRSQCLDKLRNFILLDVDETVVKVDASTGEDTLVKRRLGQVMVPGKHLVKVEVEEKAWQAALVGGQPGAPRDEAKSGAETAPR